MPRPRAKIDTEALVEAFAPDGFHGTSAERLACVLGVAKPTLYTLGESKAALFLLAVEAEVERVLTVHHAADSRSVGQSARDRAAAGTVALLTHARVRPAGARLLYRTAIHRRSSVAETVTATVRRVPDRLEACLRRDLAVDGLDPSLAPWLARSILGAVTILGEARPGERRLARAELAAIACAPVPHPARETLEGWII